MTGFLRKRVMLAAAAMAAVAGIATFQLFDPNLAGNPFPACVFLAVTDLYCAGCGITRALHALAHGDLLRAVQMNLFAVVAMPLLGLMVWFADSPESLPGGVARWLYNGYLWVGALIAFWVLRNLPWWPFSWLAPG